MTQHVSWWQPGTQTGPGAHTWPLMALTHCRHSDTTTLIKQTGDFYNGYREAWMLYLWHRCMNGISHGWLEGLDPRSFIQWTKLVNLGNSVKLSLTVHWPQEAIIRWSLSKQVSSAVKLSRDGGWGHLRWAPSASGMRRRRCRAAGLTVRVTPPRPTATRAMTRTSDTSRDTGGSL